MIPTIRTAFGVFASIVTCLVLYLSIGLLPGLERDTGPTISSLELVSHPAAEVLQVAIAPSAITAKAHGSIASADTNTYRYMSAYTAVVRYESVSSKLGRRAATTAASYGKAIAPSDTESKAPGHPLRC